MSLASTLITTLTLITLMAIMMLNFFADAFVQNINKRIDMEIFLMDDAQSKDVQDLQNTLDNNKDIQSVTFISKAEALEIWKQKMAAKPQFLDAVSAQDNPLPASFKIKVDNPEKLLALSTDLKSQYGANVIETISTDNDQTVIENIVKTTKNARNAGYILSAFFIVVAILIVYNTMRITIYTRKDEIEIMKLVGATNTYVRWPFMTEAVLYGFLSGAISLVGSYFVLTLSSAKILAYTQVNILGLFDSHGVEFFALSFGVGVVLSLISSTFAIRKYLKV